jgi:hypothetical protein
MWSALLQHPRGAYYTRVGSLAIQKTGLTPKPWDECDSFLQLPLWPGPIDMDIPPGEIWGTEEQATNFDLDRQLKEDQPPEDVRDTQIRHILGRGTHPLWLQDLLTIFYEHCNLHGFGMRSPAGRGR